MSRIVLLTAIFILTAIACPEVFAKKDQKPKSIHTWLVSEEKEIFAYDVDVKISQFPRNPNPKWLYFMSLQVNFTDHDEWSHGGLQWIGYRKFLTSGNKGVNWGGGSDWAGYGGIGSQTEVFLWQTDKWYRYRVWRLPRDENGLWRWLFLVLDYETGVEKRFGTVVTKSAWIKSAVVFTETGYGVECGTERAVAEWRNQVYRSTFGIHVPSHGIATYNGTCIGKDNTNQEFHSKQPLRWNHMTKVRREVKKNTRLW